MRRIEIRIDEFVKWDGGVPTGAWLGAGERILGLGFSITDGNLFPIKHFHDELQSIMEDRVAWLDHVFDPPKIYLRPLLTY